MLFFLSKSLSCKLLQELIDYFFDQVYAISFIIIAMDPLVFFYFRYYIRSKIYLVSWLSGSIPLQNLLRSYWRQQTFLIYWQKKPFCFPCFLFSNYKIQEQNIFSIVYCVFCEIAIRVRLDLGYIFLPTHMHEDPIFWLYFEVLITGKRI